MDYDIIIIGAGLLGCFTARNLRRYNLSVLVLEQAPDVCTGISKANSGIIYPGYDMAPGSLKAKLTVKACIEFPKLCKELGVPYRNCGSLMTGTGPLAKERIEKKYRKGLSMGIPGLKLLDGLQCLLLEPSLSQDVITGLYAAGTCSVNPWDLCIAGFENARDNGARFLFNRMVTKIDRIAENSKNLFKVTAGDKTFTCRFLINCAGLKSDKVHEMVSDPSIRLRPTGADYLILEEASDRMPAHVIFQEPEEKGKGLTIVPTVDKNTLIGPTDRESYEEKGNPTKPEQLKALLDDCHSYLPGMPTDNIIHTFGSSRPNPYEVIIQKGQWTDSGSRLPDFNILEEDGFLSLIGIKTPGLTCCNVLGEYVSEKAAVYLGDVSDNPDFDPVRERPAHIHGASLSERQLLIRQDPSYGRIICSCRDISEGEIRLAVRKGGHTLDGVKRRCGVLMGQCQGSRCLGKILEIMADEIGCSAEVIQKELIGSHVL